MINKSKLTTKVNQLTIKEACKMETLQQNEKTNYRVIVAKPCLSIIALNVN